MSYDSHRPTLNPAQLLQDLADNHFNGYLKVSTNSISWQVYFESGKLIYATYIIKNSPFHLFYRIHHHLNQINLRELSGMILGRSFQERLRAGTLKEHSFQCFDHFVILWLLRHQYLNSSQAEKLTMLLTKEAFELFLFVTVTHGNYQAQKLSDTEFKLCELDCQQMLEYYQRRSQQWDNLSPEIRSPYQHLHLVDLDLFLQSNEQDPLTTNVKQKLIRVLDGHSIHDLAALLNWDELKIAKFLYPYVVNEAIHMEEPRSPFDQLPKPILVSLEPVDYPKRITKPKENLSSIPKPSKKHGHMVVCIDDSPNMLDTIEQYLLKANFAVFKISEPIKAVLQLRRIEPDVILLDVGMPLVNGYELCRLLRTSPRFREIPIIMVTGKDGIINKVKAQMVGATDYLTKPFTESDLLEMVHRHLT